MALSFAADKSPGLARAETTIRPRPLDMMKPKSLSLDLDNPPPPQVRDFRTPTDGTPNVRMRKFKVNTTGNIPEAKIFMVWLESYEDHENFPAGLSFLLSLSSRNLIESFSQLPFSLASVCLSLKVITITLGPQFLIFWGLQIVQKIIFGDLILSRQ